jgi:hypothetical protein
MPPQFSGSTSTSVSVKSHLWPYQETLKTSFKQGKKWRYEFHLGGKCFRSSTRRTDQAVADLVGSVERLQALLSL